MSGENLDHASMEDFRNMAAALANARATEAVLRGEIRRSESALATFDDLAARLAAVPRCVWHQGNYPETCWWCGLNLAAPHADPSEAQEPGSGWIGA